MAFVMYCNYAVNRYVQAMRGPLFQEGGLKEVSLGLQQSFQYSQRQKEGGLRK